MRAFKLNSDEEYEKAEVRKAPYSTSLKMILNITM